MIHLTAQQFSSYMDGELNEVSTELVRRHMGLCEECTLKFAALEVQEEHLSQALVHEPGDDFFDRFAAEVERQLAPGKESKRGPSPLASRAAAVREAARKAAASTPFPSDESDLGDRPVVAKRPTVESKPAPSPPPVAKPPAPVPVAAEPPPPALSPTPGDEGDDAAFDDDVVLAELSAGRPVSPEVPIPRPTPVKQPVLEPASGRREAAARPSEQRAAARSSEQKASPPAARPAARPTARPVQRRPQTRRPTPSIPWYAAAILALIAGASGVVVSRTDPVSAWLDSHKLESLLPGQKSATPVDAGSSGAAPDQEPANRDAQEQAAGAGSESGRVAPPDDATQHADNSGNSDEDFEPQPQAADWFIPPASTAVGRDPFADLPPSSLAQVRAAQRSKAAADASPSAARYEAAAAEWERTIPLLRGSRQQSLGRLELASSRYRAWENAPTEARAAMAAVALRTYLTLAPQGAPRDLVKSWLARVSR